MNRMPPAVEMDVGVGPKAEGARRATGAFGPTARSEGRAYALVDALLLALRRFWGLVSRSAAPMSENWTAPSWIRPMTPTHLHILPGLQEGSSATGC